MIRNMNNCILKMQLVSLEDQQRKLGLIFVNTNSNIDQYLFVLKQLSKFNANVRILKEYKWKNLSNIIPLFYIMDISMDEFITFNKL